MKQEYVLGFLFDLTEQSVCLIKKNKPVWQCGFLNGVGGKIEYGEGKYEAMSREFLEETGVYIDINEWEHVGNMKGPTWLVHCFKATSESIKQVETITEEEVGIYTITSLLKQNTLTNIPWLVHFCLDDKPYRFNVEYKI